MYWRFAWGLKGFLEEPITLERSTQLIRQRLQNRERNFLLIAKKAIFENRTSPYLKLLELAGCQYGDLEHLVQSFSLDSALIKLAKEGVYLRIEEFKGKSEIKRAGKTLQFKERDFDNPFLAGHMEARSGGTRSAGTRTIYDFDHLIANLTTYRIAMLDVYDAFDAPFAIWAPIMPGGGPPLVLSITKAGKTPVAWFSPVESRSFKPSLKNRMGTSFIVHSGRFSGAKLPAPIYVSLDDAGIVTEFMAEQIKQKGSCCLHSYPSLAIRVCQAARERGIDLCGAIFFTGGEPITEAKRKEVTSVGAAICPIYVFMEGGFIGAGCRNPLASDDVHLFKDSFALIQRPREVIHAATSVEAFLFSTLLPSSPKILLNVESGDWGIMSNRSCGCKFEEYGFTEHLHNIRGFDKLTGEGMTFVGTDLVRIIEEVLPARFGGASTDYQMVEEEDKQGHTRMNIVISPELGEIDEPELINIVLREVSKGKDTQRMMAEVWAQAKTLRVKRAQPFATARGKLMPLHIHYKNR